ncbi:hypothetical protein EHF33_04000 [Deinococcus psychrotolerans]|uniref:Uncharacterized protein n=2 Tax=Deinococcus TaxID=1298 RepID=A0A553V165_9DEIO|nr:MULTISPECIES: hypothetical protein [Deinococcus]AZI42016.1 hypothetical protein EHF33_04000 [Deinococcus psychrotolerans]TSA86193.1 hypothetical protein FNU79_08490 [Deinococcus detaillensis]
MNEQLSQTLQAAKDGVASIPAAAAVSNVTSWHSALSGVPGAETLVDHLAKLKSALESGKLDEAAKILPGLGSETEKLAAAAPAADKDGLMQLAKALKG